MVTLGPETSTQKVNIHRVTMCPLSVLFSVLQEENLHVLFITSYGTHLYIPSFFTAMVNIHIQQFAQCKYKYSQEAVLFWFFILVLYNGNEQIFVPWSPRAHRSDGEPKSPTHLLFKLLFTKSRRRRGEREGAVYLVSDRIK